jgi:hypothetical protein
MGAVYLADEEALDRLVAIKVLPPELNDPHARERFKREARIAARLSHPNIVPLHTFGEVAGVLYFVMGFVHGESLADMLGRERILVEQQARPLLAALARAAGFAHARGVLHRDIKPENILIEAETGTPMLTDFGIAKPSGAVQTLTELGHAIGTPSYMSPEQASGEREIDGRSDLYSLGIVAYRMVTGRLPFEGDGIREIIAKHVGSDPVPLRSVSPQLSEEFTHAIMRCLKKDPVERWPDAESLAKALEIKRFWEVEPPEGMAHAQLQTQVGLGLSVLGFGGFVAATLQWGSDGALASIGLGLLGLVGILEQYIKGHRKHDRLTTLRAMFRPPNWWGLRLPAWLRPEDDVWERLPKPVKAVRDAYAWMLLGVGVGLVVVWPAAIYLFSRVIVLEPLWLSALAPALLSFVPAFAGIGLHEYRDRAFRGWAKDLKLPGEDVRKLGMHRSFGSSFWDHPRIARLLESDGPDEHVKAPAMSDTPLGLFHAITRAVGELDGALADIGREAQKTAARLKESVGALDSEMRLLSQDANPEVIRRLEQRIASLGNAAETDQDGAAHLLRQQLELAKRLQQRLEDVVARRAKLMNWLKTLLLQIANLRAASLKDRFEEDDVSGEVRALCAEIHEQISATQTVNLMLSGHD